MKYLYLLSFLWVGLASAEWKQGAGYRFKELPALTGKSVGFDLVSPSFSGVYYTNAVSDLSIAKNRILPNGSGVALGDYDGDGLADIFVCGLEVPCKLFRNLGGWKFRDVTSEANFPVDCVYARGAVFADLDGDGTLDLLVSTVREGVRCFMNRGAKLTEKTAESGLKRESGSTTLALADVDGNGSLDLYVTNYRTNDIRDVGRVSFRNVGGKPLIPEELKSRFLLRDGEIAEYGEVDQLYLNDGKGHFSPVSWTEGAFLDASGQRLREPPLDWGLTVTFRDINQDGAPDIYVCNDYWTPDRMWINDGKGHFQAAPPLTLRKIPSSSMGVDFSDINRDGILDFFCVEMLATLPGTRKRQMLADKPAIPSIGINADLPQVFHNTLYVGREDGTFAEVAYLAGLHATDWSWSPLFLDVDLDGYEDLLISAGHFSDVQDLDAQAEIRRRQRSWTGFANEDARQAAFTRELEANYRLYPKLQLPLRAFRNQGGLRFLETTSEWGFTSGSVRHGMALADLDGDGDLDLVVNGLHAGLELYRNKAEAGRVAIRLRGRNSNTRGIGARLLVRDEKGVQQKEITAGGSYLSGSDSLAVFGVSTTASVEIQWPNRRKSTRSRVEVSSGRLYEIFEPELISSIANEEATLRPWFDDVSSRLGHTHRETAFDDFQRQPLLPFKLSQQGPSLAWFDVDGDGFEDLMVGSGGGFSPEVYYSDGAGGLAQAKDKLFPVSKGDCLGVLGYRMNSGSRFLLMGMSGYESPQENPIAVYSLTNQARTSIRPAAVPSTFASASVLALGSFGAPGELALFVGGGPDPGRYPLAAPCGLLRIRNGEFRWDARNSSQLSSVGLVNAAVWTDLDGDGTSELVLACEWGPIRVFANRGLVLNEITSELGLSTWTGLWRGIASADVDGDGRLDLIAGNWGLNSAWRASPDHPFTAYFGEISQPSVVEFIETEWDPVTSALTAHRALERLMTSMPFIGDSFPSFKSLAEASLSQMLGERRVLAREIRVKTLASMVFLNRGNRFEATELPMEAQFAPVFSVSAADFDGDGGNDLFLSQNLMGMHPDYSRQDSGRGLMLRGDGKGRFRAVSGSDSGIRIYGEQRGSAVCDFDHDGRLDLVVGQNGASTRLYRNQSGKSGVRVVLVGPPGNFEGIGAQLWTESAGLRSAVQEVQVGSGWLSCDGTAKVMVRKPDSTLRVRWPGGGISSVRISENQQEVQIPMSGSNR